MELLNRGMAATRQDYGARTFDGQARGGPSNGVRPISPMTV